MKRFTPLLLALLLVLFGLTGCSKYSSHYTAVMYVHSGTPDSADMIFYIFEGTEVFELNCESGKTARLHYTGKLESGSLTVYVDCGEDKTELFSLHAGDTADAYSDPLSAGRVYVIIETSEKCETGELTFELVYD